MVPKNVEERGGVGIIKNNGHKALLWGTPETPEQTH